MELGNIESPARQTPPHVETPWGKRSTLIACAIGVASFFFYRFILDYYRLGDPFFYQRYYDSLAGRDLITALLSQRNYLGSSELIYPTIVWFGANAGIERNTLMAAFNGIMYAALFSALRFYRCNIIFIALCLTNFYIVVISTSAERLKFAYICLFFALMASGRAKIIWLALAPLTHLQSLIIQGAIFIWHFFASFSLRTKVIISGLTAVGGAAILYLFSGALIEKFFSYQGRGGIVESLTGLAIFGISLAIFKNKFSVFMAFLPLIALTFFIGSERMNMITFTVFIYIAIKEKKTSHPIVLVAMAYLSLKSFGYVENIIGFGNGFAGS